MTLTQILAWLTGPAVGSALSFLLEKYQPWVLWKPKDALGFNPKAAVVSIASLLIGYAAYQFAASVPATFVTLADPYVAAAFPILSMLTVQLWHRFINSGLNTISIKATVSTPGSVSAEAKTSYGSDVALRE